MLTAAATMVALLAAGLLHGRLRTAAAVAAAAGGFALALLSGGVPEEYLRPDRWGDLAAAIGRGLSALPGARVPYRGLDEWTRIVITLGGTVLSVLAAIVAFWPRDRGLGARNVALVLLMVLYAVPAIALDLGAEFLSGALLAILVVAFLRLERLRIGDAAAAGILAVGVAILGMAAAPALDTDEPWFDYETWALSNASAKSTTFSWEHTYGPLDWPRDGRELLRVKARRPAYWKAHEPRVLRRRALDARPRLGQPRRLRGAPGPPLAAAHLGVGAEPPVADVRDRGHRVHGRRAAAAAHPARGRHLRDGHAITAPR